MILVSRNISYTQIFAGVPERGGVMNDDIFCGHFGDYFFRNVRQKVSTVYNLQTKTNKKYMPWQGNGAMM